ncbi:malate synthase A [Marinoscillum sp.]|uniref:malate synthase A n=1 Tax=Marinoscillum sp. TaxID=2024838 RepID=UPI003BAD08A5
MITAEANTIDIQTPLGLRLHGKSKDSYSEILTPDALDFLLALHERFNQRRKRLLQDREVKQAAYDAGVMPDFLPETEDIRTGDWQIAPIPSDIQDRRVEITGPVERKMIINALNSGAKVFMADFEDSNTPNWSNTIEGQINLRDAIKRTIDFENPINGKQYKLNEEVATLFVRPRGWHLEEKHILIHDEPTSGALVDFGLYFFHNAHELLQQGSGPYFYLPKLESHLEARLWNEVFVFAQNYLGIPQGTIKATVLIETLPAAFELHEILYELRNHSCGLNCGRWDYIFSYIKKFRANKHKTVPNRDQVTMTSHFMKSYSDLVIQTCHRRGAHAMGGMAAQIPIKNNEEANKAALDKVRQDKLREVQNGHDGTWVAHPALVTVAMEVFDAHMPWANQINNKRNDVYITAKDLTQTPTGTITIDGIRTNINVGLLYTESWLRGNGAAAIYNLMEDAATAEISRSQLWQWIHHNCYTVNGTNINIELYEHLKLEELEKIQELVGSENFENGRFKEAVQLFDRLVKSDQLEDFLTLNAYDYLN